MLRGFRESLKWLDPFTYVDNYLMPFIKNLPIPAQWAVFALSYIILIAAVFSLLGGNIIVAALLTAVFLYFIFFSRSTAVESAVYMLSAFAFAFILYTFVLSFLLGSSIPLVIVYSGSMEPMLYRGDVAILTGASSVDVAEARLDFPVRGKMLGEYATIGYERLPSGRMRAAGIKVNGAEYRFDSSGPVVVYNSGLRGQDIIHRAVLRLRAPDGDSFITFGDNNERIDQDCRLGAAGYDCISLYPVPLQELKGKYLFHVPLLGYVKLLVFDDLPQFFGVVPGSATP